MTPLQEAAQAVINQCEVEALWAPYPWLGAKLAELRKALDDELVQSVEPYAVFQGLVDSGEHGAFNLDLLKMIPRGAYLYLHPPQPQATTPAVPELLEELENCRDLLKIAFPDAPVDSCIGVGIIKASAAIAAAQGEKPRATTPVVPEGYVLVPVEPTPAMCAEGLEDEGLTIKDGFKYAYALYKCMVKTAQGEKP